MSDWQIIIAERGWVYVGTPTRVADKIVITNCYCIRRWGTTAGLGELALKGPTSESVLDYYGTVRIFCMAVVGEIECHDPPWQKYAAKRKQ